MSPAARLRVLVADDHPLMLEAASTILSASFEVATVSSGFAAVDAAIQLQPDVVVLDIAMPGLNGFETASRLRAAGSPARVVFLSNHVEDDYVLKALSVGASGFVPKPRMRADLIAAIDHAIAGRTFLPSASVLPQTLQPGEHPHLLQLYSSDALLVDAVANFFESALDAGHSIVAIGTQTHLDGIDAAFWSRGVDVASLVSSGRYARASAIAAIDAMTVNGVVDADLLPALLDPLVNRGLSAATNADPRVFLWGEVAPTLCAREQFAAARRLERAAGDYVVSRRLTILCGYSTDCIDADAGRLVVDLCAGHSAVLATA